MNIRQLAMRVAYETANLFRRGGNLAGAVDSTLTAADATHPAIATDGIGNEFTIRRNFGAVALPLWPDGNVPIFDATTNLAPCSFTITDVTLFVSTVAAGAAATLQIVGGVGAVTDGMLLSALGLVRQGDTTPTAVLAAAVVPGDVLTLVRAGGAVPTNSVGEVIIRCVKTG
jgi:hypothetical protein